MYHPPFTTQRRHHEGAATARRGPVSVKPACSAVSRNSRMCLAINFLSECRKGPAAGAADEESPTGATDEEGPAGAATEVSGRPDEST